MCFPAAFIHACEFYLTSCFACVTEWATQKRTCPLCISPLGPYILHGLDPSTQRFLKHYFDSNSAGPSAPQRRPPPDINSLRHRDESRQRQKLDRALEYRRHVYRHNLYSKHVASNRYTRYKPYPPPTAFRNNPVYARLLSVFLERELQVWPHVDVPFLSFYIPALLSHVDIRSDAMIDQLEEWIGNRDDALLLSHEIEMFVRSGRGGNGLDQYDSNPWLQYDQIDNVS